MPADELRARFSRAMSAMYREEVPQYGTLLQLVADVNDAHLEANPDLRRRLAQVDQLERISEERHGAIRLGTAEELATMRRLFAVLGMYPVGYYDLSVAGIPVHSTAFRPIAADSLGRNPFRVFTSLLRLDLIENKNFRAEAHNILAHRDIFTTGLRELLEVAESNGGLTEEEASRLLTEALETFRWHPTATVPAETYARLHDAHRLIADVVCFRGPHINHLTPRTLDIDRVQALMPQRGINPKAVVEGPPPRDVSILLRQTSFKALEEVIQYPTPEGTLQPGSHTARFGEIEQRGAALTPQGRALYDQLLNEVREKIRPAPDGSNADAYRQTLADVFKAFPDDPQELRRQRLAYFRYQLTEKGQTHRDKGETLPDRETALAEGLVMAEPQVYEDFLPVSAAGIFQSNLGDKEGQAFTQNANQAAFEEALGAPVQDEFTLYAESEKASLQAAGLDKPVKPPENWRL